MKIVDDKRQITRTFAIPLTGECLPVQVTYQGKTSRCLPKQIFSEHSTSRTRNHWSNTQKYVEFFQHVIFPYL